MYIELGSALLKVGSYAEAKQLLLRALELNDTQIEANRLLAELFLHEKNYPEATKHEAIFKERSRGSQQKRGGAGGGSGESSSSDDDTESTAADAWKRIKKESLCKAKYGRVIYHRIKDPNGQKHIWVSRDTAKHAGSAFKVWLEKGSRIVFDSSYDENLKRMAGKHESNAGREIMISAMDKLKH